LTTADSSTRDIELPIASEPLSASENIPAVTTALTRHHLHNMDITIAFERNANNKAIGIKLDIG